MVLCCQRLLHRLLQVPTSSAVAALSPAALYHPVPQPQQPWLLLSRGLASHQGPTSPQQPSATGAPHQAPPAATHAAGTSSPTQRAHGILGPLARCDIWWREVLRDPFQFRFYNPAENLQQAELKVIKSQLGLLEVGVQYAVDASFDVNSFMVGARLAIWHVMESVLNHDPAALTPCVTTAVEEVVRSSLMRLPYHYVDPEQKTMGRCESWEADVKVECVLPGPWGLLPAHTLAQLDPQRAAWLTGPDPLQHPPPVQDTQDGKGGPYWLVIEVLTCVDYSITTPHLEGAIVVAPGRDHPADMRSWDVVASSQVLRWYLARGPVPRHPHELWAAEPWFVLAVLLDTPLQAAELRWAQQAPAHLAGDASNLVFEAKRTLRGLAEGHRA